MSNAGAIGGAVASVMLGCPGCGTSPLGAALVDWNTHNRQQVKARCRKCGTEYPTKRALLEGKKKKSRKRKARR